MYREKLATIALLACCVLAGAAPPATRSARTVPLTIEGDTVTVVKSLPFRIVAAPGADFYLWAYPQSWRVVEDPAGVITVQEAPEGVGAVVRVSSIKVDFEAKKIVKDAGEIIVNIGAQPGPNPPVPPVPPVPPPGQGDHVLFVYESADASKLTPAQMQVIYGGEIRGWLNGKLPLEKNGKTHAWRIFDKDINVTGDEEVWKSLLAGKKDVPGIVIGDSAGKVVYAGPLPAGVNEAKTLLGKYLK